MQPEEAASPFDDPAYFFEPWWPGSRALVFLDDDGMRLQSEHLVDAMAAFPELRVIAHQGRGRPLVLDGTLLVLDEAGRPDPELLRARLRDGAGPGTGAFVASDLLYEGGRSLLARPFRDRRERLRHSVRDGDLCVVSRGVREEGITMARAVGSLGLDALSARELSGRYRRGHAGSAWLRIPLVPDPPVERRPLLALLQRLPL